MRTKKSKRLYHLVLEYRNGITKNVTVRATTRELAEKRAMKFHPNAVRVKHNA